VASNSKISHALFSSLRHTQCYVETYYKTLSTFVGHSANVTSWIRYNVLMPNSKLYYCYGFCTVHCNMIIQHKPTKCTFLNQYFIFWVWCLIHVSNTRVHLQVDGCICSYGMVRVTCPSGWKKIEDIKIKN